MVTGFLVGLSAITLTFGPSALADPSDQDAFNLVARPPLTLMAVSATGFLVRPMTPLVVAVEHESWLLGLRPRVA